MNDHDVARALRALPWGKDIVLIALSGWGQPDDMRRSLDAGFNHRLAKPAERGEVERLFAARGKCQCSRNTVGAGCAKRCIAGRRNQEPSIGFGGT